MLCAKPPVLGVAVNMPDSQVLWLLGERGQFMATERAISDRSTMAFMKWDNFIKNGSMGFLNL
jgi:hypothetical protein